MHVHVRHRTAVPRDEHGNVNLNLDTFPDSRISTYPSWSLNFHLFWCALAHGWFTKYPFLQLSEVIVLGLLYNIGNESVLTHFIYGCTLFVLFTYSQLKYFKSREWLLRGKFDMRCLKLASNTSSTKKISVSLLNIWRLFMWQITHFSIFLNRCAFEVEVSLYEPNISKVTSWNCGRIGMFASTKKIGINCLSLRNQNECYVFMGDKNVYAHQQVNRRRNIEVRQRARENSLTNTFVKQIRWFRSYLTHTWEIEKWIHNAQSGRSKSNWITYYVLSCWDFLS